MVDVAGRTPEEVNAETPNVARVYDYYLGGCHNFAVDRAFAHDILRSFPEARDFAIANRRYQGRAVRHVSEQGVRQFLDLGAGIPTINPTHQVACSVNSNARVVYVDNEPIAAAHSEMMLTGENQAAVMQGDLRKPQQILTADVTRQMLDFSQPIAVMMLAILHFVPDDEDPAAVIAEYIDALVPGSYLIISHATQEGPIGDRVAMAAQKYEATKLPGHLRTRDQIAELVSPVELIEPGIVWTASWRPEDPEDAVDAERSVAYAAVGYKR